MVKRIGNLIKSGVQKVRRLSLVGKLGLVALFLMLAITGSVAVTERPQFCNSCHIMNSYYKSWKVSSHHMENCLDCHLVPGVAGHVRGKINGLAQLVDCVMDRYGTKPNATVQDVSCLRDGCHSIAALATKPLTHGKTKFAHEKHLSKEVDGIKISCTTCHSHFEGDEHFKVNTEACFTCHFLKNNKDNKRLVNTQCKSCHEVPKEVIKRDFIEINHTDFISYGANCDDSCHVKQIQKSTEVSPSVCLSCHTYRNDNKYDGAQLHAMHSNGHKVECFDCHGEISHKAISGGMVAAMPDCSKCHSNTHQLQSSMYSAQNGSPHTKGDLILSPMFLTHVDCTGCHIERVASKPDNIGSKEMVTKAVPKACDKCHEAGTGQKYIPFWQDTIKKLYEQVNGRLEKVEKVHAQLVADGKTSTDYDEKVHQAKLLLESVANDGSWGVHNFKYTESVLLKANTLLTDLQKGQL